MKGKKAATGAGCKRRMKEETKQDWTRRQEMNQCDFILHNQLNAINRRMAHSSIDTTFWEGECRKLGNSSCETLQQLDLHEQCFHNAINRWMGHSPPTHPFGGGSAENYLQPSCQTLQELCLCEQRFHCTGNIWIWHPIQHTVWGVGGSVKNQVGRLVFLQMDANSHVTADGETQIFTIYLCALRQENVRGFHAKIP